MICFKLSFYLGKKENSLEVITFTIVSLIVYISDILIKLTTSNYVKGLETTNLRQIIKIYYQ